jgi:hypothetical protein
MRKFYLNQKQKCFKETIFLKITISNIFILIIYIFMKFQANTNIESYNCQISNFNKLNILKELIKIYTILYDSYRDGYTKPKFLNNNYSYFSIKQDKLGICICSIVKNENLYIREFINYYYLLGVDKIIIYDNNDIEGETINNIIKDYIINQFVEIIDVRGLSSIQIPIYNYCYRKNKDIYDWIGFIDIDEYLYIKNEKNIKNYFFSNRFQKCQTIYFNWIIYNDNNKIKYENKPLNKRFTIQKSFFNQGKSFVRGGLNKLIIPTTMIPGINIHYFCNSNGENIYPINFYNNNFENNPKAFLKHYYTKTAEEFCNKLRKGNAHFNKYHADYNNTIKDRINLFFSFNNITKEKIKILEQCSGFNLQKYLKK